MDRIAGRHFYGADRGDDDRSRRFTQVLTKSSLDYGLSNVGCHLGQSKICLVLFIIAMDQIHRCRIIHMCGLILPKVNRTPGLIDAARNSCSLPEQMNLTSAFLLPCIDVVLFFENGCRRWVGVPRSDWM